MAIAPAPTPPTVEILEKLPEISLTTLLAKNKMPQAQLPITNYQLPMPDAPCPMPHAPFPILISCCLDFF